MTKISDSVKVIVSNNLIYSMAISSGLCNYTKIAENIRDKVEAMTGKNVKFNTIVKGINDVVIHTARISKIRKKC